MVTVFWDQNSTVVASIFVSHTTPAHVMWFYYILSTINNLEHFNDN